VELAATGVRIGKEAHLAVLTHKGWSLRCCHSRVADRV
jgi:hypothetical protein